MKKLLLLFLAIAGMVSTASATDYYIASDENGWANRTQMVENGDGTYTGIITLRPNYTAFHFTIVEGDPYNVDNAYHPDGADNHWGIDANNTPTMKKSVNDKVLTYPANNTIARALKVVFNPSTGACTVTRLIAVASSYNSWSTTTDYLEETSRGSNIYTGYVTLDTGYGFKYIYVKSGDEKWGGKNDDGFINDDNGSNYRVAVDGVYYLYAQFNDWKWTDPVLQKVTASVGTYGMATLCSEYALDFTGIENVKAYTITNNDKTNGTLEKSQVTGKVKGGTGLYIEGAANASVDVPTTIYTISAGTNFLVGVTSGTKIEQEDGANTNYILTVNKAVGGNAYTPKFFKVNDAGNTIPAGKAYLQIPTASAAREFFWFDEDVTAIEAVKQEQTVNGQAYNLAGQRVAQPTKGFYIVNGKKFIKK